jgi:CheY-like chemotaxis protein
VAKTQEDKSTPLTVLVAEDEPTVRALAESIIEEVGYTTFSAANAREALALLEDGASITLLFTDINMPDGPDGLDGLELARRAVELRPDLRVIYTTGGGLTDGMSALFVEGGTFLPKPFTRQQLVAAVQGDGDIAEKHPAL